MKAKSNVILVLVVLMMIALVGCGSLLDRVTPSTIPKRAATYAKMPDKEGVQSLYDAEIIKRELGIVHRDNQLAFMRQIEDDKLAYDDARVIVENNIADSRELQSTVLNGVDMIPGVNSMLYGMGGLLVGRNFLKRPGDLTKEEAASQPTEQKA